MLFHELDHRKIDFCCQQLFLLAILAFTVNKSNGIVPVIIILILYASGRLLRKMGSWLADKISHWMAFPVF